MQKTLVFHRIVKEYLLFLLCWRLMGFDNDDFYKVKSVGMSDTQAYKQAGNSIVVNVLEAIFEKLFA